LKALPLPKPFRIKVDKYLQQRELSENEKKLFTELEN
jgi:hypothetical protein